MQRGQAGPQTGQQRGSEQRGQAGQQNRRETTGQAPGSERGNQSSEERKTGQAGERRGQSTRERETTGQNERGQNERNVRGDRERERTTGQAGQSERRDNDQLNRNDRRDRVQGERGESRTTVEGSEGGRSSVNVQLSQEQRTRIHDVIIKERSAPRVANVDFSLDVGTRVPRTVKLVRVPTSIIEIEPRWRGFEYFLVGDEIVIVDPNVMEIVAVIPA